MSEKNVQLMKTTPLQTAEFELRLLPFIVAGTICFSLAVLLGSGSWYVFGSQNRQEIVETTLPNNNISPNQTTAKDLIAVDAPPTPTVNAVKTEIKGLVEVAGSEIAIGGGETKQPLKRVFVANFSMAETEVTNLQYAEFIKETNHRAPDGWRKDQFPKGTENFPVTNVSFQDAIAFCLWLSKKSDLNVRLPNEAEWELAARGREGNKYPWGNELDNQSIMSKEKGGKILAVKSFPNNRSPFGVYDMAGNVWEWTQDKINKDQEVTDERVKIAQKKGQVLRIVKGGSAQEEAAQISAQARYEIPENTKVAVVGFRYVIEPKQNP